VTWGLQHYLPAGVNRHLEPSSHQHSCSVCSWLARQPGAAHSRQTSAAGVQLSYSPKADPNDAAGKCTVMLVQPPAGWAKAQID
jgi:hypothetical protein